MFRGVGFKMSCCEVEAGRAIAMSAEMQTSASKGGVRDGVEGVGRVLSDEMGLVGGGLLCCWCVGVELPGTTWEHAVMGSWCCLGLPIGRLKWRGQQSPRH